MSSSTHRSARTWRDIDGILMLDKPLGLSSNAALQQARRLFQAAKAGHTGTLDPLATGLLPICFGRATKLCAYLLDADKLYRAQAIIGARTSTGDLEGQVLETSDASLCSEADLRSVLPRFTGNILQVPPMYSALKRDGQRLYQLAREGIEVDREPRQITVHQLTLLNFSGGGFELEVRCSKGTYIRTLVEDIATAMQQAAHLTALRRLEVAPFRAPVLITAEQLETLSAMGLQALDELLMPAAAVFADWPKVSVDEQQAHYLSRGQAVGVADAPGSGLLAVFDGAGAMLGIARIDDHGRVAPKRWL